MQGATVAQLVRSSMARRARKRQAEIATRTGGQTDSERCQVVQTLSGIYSLRP